MPGKKSGNNPQGVHWCFTWNNPDGLIMMEEWKGLKYGVYQLEMGEEGTPHFQGYAHFHDRKRLSQLKKLNDAIHWEPCRDRVASRNYCMKADTRLEGPFEFGKWDEKAQGNRCDLMAVKEMLDLKKTEVEIADGLFPTWCKYFRGIERYKRLKTDVRREHTFCVVRIGVPGTGKSEAVSAEAGTNGYWKQRGEWWDGYDGHESVILDDFYGWIRYDQMLRIVDKNPLMVETKGGQAQFLAKRIFITSNKPPHRWYKSEKCDFKGLERRLEGKLGEVWLHLKDEEPIKFDRYLEFREYYDKHFPETVQVERIE